MPGLYCDAVRVSGCRRQWRLGIDGRVPMLWGVFPHMIERSAASTILRLPPTLTGTQVRTTARYLVRSKLVLTNASMRTYNPYHRIPDNYSEPLNPGKR